MNSTMWEATNLHNGDQVKECTPTMNKHSNKLGEQNYCEESQEEEGERF